MKKIHIILFVIMLSTLFFFINNNNVDHIEERLYKGSNDHWIAEVTYVNENSKSFFSRSSRKIIEKKLVFTSKNSLVKNNSILDLYINKGNGDEYKISAPLDKNNQILKEITGLGTFQKEEPLFLIVKWDSNSEMLTLFVE